MTHAAEGWYLDPFARHEQRWFSGGRPTSLVQDDGTDTRDEPPTPIWDGPLERPAERPAVNETLRADDEPPTTGLWPAIGAGSALPPPTDR